MLNINKIWLPKLFQLTRSGLFYNNNLKQANLFPHIRSFINFADEHKDQSNVIHMDGILKPPQIIFECDNFIEANDNDAFSTILSDLMSQDVTFSLYNIKPDECKISKISLTKLLIESNDNSLFEKNVNGYIGSSISLNETLIYNAAIVITKIIPKKLCYKEFEVTLYNISPNLRKEIRVNY